MNTFQPDLNRNLIERVAIGDMLRRRARASGNREALVDFHGGSRRSLTYKEFNSQVNRVLRGLREQGLKQGDRVALLCSNRIEFFVVAFACYKAGMVFMPVNFVQNQDDIRYNLEHAKARAVIFESGLAQLTLGCAEGLDHIIRKFCIGDSTIQGCVSFAELLDRRDDSEIEDVILGDRDVIQLLYSSGTTSRPKGVETSNLSIYFASLSNALTLGYGQHHSALIVLPVFHCAALMLSISALQTGGKAVLTSAFESADALRLLESEQINSLALLPVMWKALLVHPDITHYDYSAMKFGLYAMAPMDSASIQRLRNAFGCEFHLASGQSEFTAMACVFYDGSPTEQVEGNYWGVPVMTAEQAVLDDQGNELSTGEIGEICWRGPHVMSGYLKNPEATAEVSQFAWHHSGDLGYIDNCGQLMFVDRKKDMIKSGGENVPSCRVEQVLLEHAEIVQAAVFGVSHPRWSEAVCAAVQLAPNALLDEPAIVAHCKEQLGGFQVPKKVFIVDSFLVTGTGKIKKVELRQRYANTFDDE